MSLHQGLIHMDDFFFPGFSTRNIPSPTTPYAHLNSSKTSVTVTLPPEGSKKHKQVRSSSSATWRRVRRKTASPDLSASIERLPSRLADATHLNAQGQPYDLPQHEASAVAHPPHLPTAHLPSVDIGSSCHPQPPSPCQALAHITPHRCPDARLRPADPVARCQTRLRRDGPFFKPRKRLPHRAGPVLPVASLDSPESPTLPPLSHHDDLVTNTSLPSSTHRFSLSAFPLPPRDTVPTPPNSSDGHVNHSKLAPTTVYHLRGASFDLVNPHDSLQIQNIETPADLEAERADYFASTMTPTMADEQSDVHTPVATLRADEAATTRSTPPRAVYHDLPSAYKSITNRAYLQKLDAGTRTGDFLPPTPLPPRNDSLQTSGSVLNPASTTTANSQAQAHTRRPSFLRDKLPSLLGLKKSSKPHITGTPTAYDAEMVLGDIDPQPADELGIEMTRGRSATRQSRGDHYYNGSFYGLSPARSGTQSLYPPSLHPHGPGLIPSEYSNEELLALYGDDSASYRRSMQSTGALSGPTRLASDNTLRNDSTIGQILDQYNRTDSSLYAHEHQPVGDEQQGNTDSPTVVETQTSSLERKDSWPLRTMLSARPQQLAPAQDIRMATIRALTPAPGTGPTRPLPADPSLPPAELRFLESMIGPLGPTDSDSQTPSSYSNTRNLLQLSQPISSIEIGRGHNETSGTEQEESQPSRTAYMSSSQAPGFTPDTEFLTMPRGARDSVRISLRDIEALIAGDIRNLKGLSGHFGELRGSFSLVTDGSATPLEQMNLPSAGVSSQSSSSNHLDAELRDRNSKTPEALTVPVPAWTSGGVLRGISRLRSSDRLALRNHESNEVQDDEHVGNTKGLPRQESIAASTAHEGDWETVNNTLDDESRFERDNRTDSSSWMDCDTRHGSLHTFSNIALHPADSRYEHTYRVHTPDRSPERGPTVLVPSYRFAGDSAFPNRNALTPPSPNIYTYTYPEPLSPRHANPFIDTPPQIDGPVARPFRYERHSKSPFEDTSQHEFAESSGFRMRHRNLSVVPEDPPHTPGTLSLDQAYPGLSRSPGPEITTEADRGSGSSGSSNKDHLKDKARSPVLSSGLNQDLMDILREGDPRKGSSPISESNSFSKFSHLGPKRNITGTPNGTRMREVGSSLVGSSSPDAILFITPSVARTSPLSEYPSSPPVAKPSSSGGRSTPLVEPYSPLAEYDRRHYGSGSPRTVSQESARFHEEMMKASRKDSITPEMDRASVRPAVRGQTKLKKMRLPSQVHRSTFSESTTGHRPLIRSPRVQVDPIWPLVPRLDLSIRENSSIAVHTAKRKTLISRNLFFFCCLLPPLLLPYWVGWYDSTISCYTQGEISHASKRYKKLAMIVGCTGTAIVVSAVTAGLVAAIVPHEA